TLDLAHPVAIKLTPASGARENDDIRLHFTAGGFPLGSGQTPVARAGGVLTADVNVSASRYLVAGRATAHVEVRRGGSEVARRSFGIRSSRSAWMTMPAFATAALLLFIGGYVESLSRTLRRRRARIGPTMGMVLMGAAFGIVAVGLAWVAAGRE